MTALHSQVHIEGLTPDYDQGKPEIKAVVLELLMNRSKTSDVLRELKRVPEVVDIRTVRGGNGERSVLHVRVSDGDVALRILEMLRLESDTDADDGNHEDEHYEYDEDDDSVDFDDSVDLDNRFTVSKMHSGANTLENNNCTGNQKI